MHANLILYKTLAKKKKFITIQVVTENILYIQCWFALSNSRLRESHSLFITWNLLPRLEMLMNENALNEYSPFFLYTYRAHKSVEKKIYMLK